MKRVYISGPMSASGRKDFNYPAFFAEARRLESLGFDVINPADTGETDTAHLDSPSWHDFMASAIKRMENATAIVFLPDWQKSHGARIEAIVAERMQLEIIGAGK